MQVLIISKDGVKNANLNRRKAIHERCLNCCCWHNGEVAKCTFKECPLYQFRTGGEKQDAKLRNSAIKNYCLLCMNGQVGEIAKCPSNKCPLYVFRRGHQVRIEKGHFSERQINFHQPIQEQRL
jgi:hypothetical protein